MLHTTVGQLLVNQALPKELRDYNRVIDGNSISTLMKQVAEKYQDQPGVYSDVAKKLSDVGRETAYRTAGFSFGLDHLKRAPAIQKMMDDLRTKLDDIGDRDDLDDDNKDLELLKTTDAAREGLEKDVYDDAIKTHNPLALQIISKARGNKTNLRSLLGADLLYVNTKGQSIPIPVLHSYAEGLSPEEYYAGTFGARKSIIDTKLATADSGYFGKLLVQAAHRLVITDNDDPDGAADENRGLPVDVSDAQSTGSLLARKTGPYNRNTVLTPRILKDLENRGHDQILIRSPLVGGPADGGLYARDAGVRERQSLPARGEFVGIPGAQAISEKVAQGSLNCLAAGTLVRMADWTVKCIEDIQVGDVVMGADAVGNTFPVSVTHTFDNGERECQQTTFRVGMSRETITLESTAEHKLLATTYHWPETPGSQEVGVFPVGKKCLRMASWMPRTVQNPQGVSEPYALLLGLLLGDGCYTRSVHGVHLSCFDPSLIDEIQEYLKTLGLRITLLAGQRGYYRISQLEKDKITARNPETGQVVSQLRNPISLKLQSLRMQHKYAHEKDIPEEVWGWDQSSVAQLIGGLFVTDGCVYVATERKAADAVHFGFASTSLPMITKLRDLLRIRFAIWPSVISGTMSGHKRKLYAFTITRGRDVIRFAECIPLYGVKRVKLSQILADRNWIPPRDYCFLYRKTVTSLGFVPTFDIEVDHPDHLFVLANGLIVSNSKHSGGVAGAAAGRAVSGFALLNQLTSVPKTFRGGATHAEADGTVQRIDEAPQGGHYIIVENKQHYVPHGAEIRVKPGQQIEAGDIMTDGLPNPAKIVQHKGIGEGRRYFVNAFRDAMKDANLSVERRNIELVARGLINHVRMKDEYGDYVPDDVVPYQTLERNWKARPGMSLQFLQSAVGKYLEQPVLHHTIGTRVTPSMLPQFSKFGINQLPVHSEPLPFEPVMIPARDNLSYDPDPMTAQLGSGLKKTLLHAAHRGRVSDTSGTSYVPALTTGLNFTRPAPASAFKPL